MLDSLYAALPALRRSVERQLYVRDMDALWNALRRLLEANAPSGGAGLPGAIGDEIAALAGELGLADRFIPRIGSTGNAGIWLGADKPVTDVVVLAHMDRPSFRVRSVADGELYAICAIRFHEDVYRVPARALRFAGGSLVVGARGVMVFERLESGGRLRFEPTEGRLTYHDTLVLDVEPTFDGVTVKGTGLDNCLGVVTALGAAAALREVESALVERGRRCLIVFTDQEEGIPEAYFGHGAARLMYTMPPPTYGCIIADAHTAGEGLIPMSGRGASHGTVSAWSRGAVVPPNYEALANDLASEINALYPNTVQMNTGYLSRSDDMPLGRWTQILGMIGAPMYDPHTGYETAQPADAQDAIRWLATYTAATLGVAPEIARAYAFVDA